MKRIIVKKTMAFSNLSEKIGFCLYSYLSLDYVCIEVCKGVEKFLCGIKPKWYSKFK